MGLCEHTVMFTDCVSSAVITSPGGNNSGFVGWSRSSNYTISFEGCVFNGKLLQQNGEGRDNGGFIGWKGDAKTVTITNCLFAPAALAAGETMASGNSATFSREHANYAATITNSYYTQPLDEAQGKEACTAPASPVGDATQTYTVSGITAYANGITRTIGDDVTFYYGDGDNVIVTGDANGDGQVTLADAVAVVNYILGNPSVNFNIAAADMNGDGNITITDAVSIVNMGTKGVRPLCALQTVAIVYLLRCIRLLSRFKLSLWWRPPVRLNYPFGGGLRCGHYGHWSFVKIETDGVKSSTIIINIYIYLIVNNDRVSEIDFDHFDHDHFDHFCCRWHLRNFQNNLVYIEVFRNFVGDYQVLNNPCAWCTTWSKVCTFA